MRNALYFGDNLKVMRDMQTARYHTCYLDPPYNSGRNYNIFHRRLQSTTQGV